MPRDLVVGAVVPGAGQEEVEGKEAHAPVLRQTREYFPPLVTIATTGVALGFASGNFAIQVWVWFWLLTAEVITLVVEAHVTSA